MSHTWFLEMISRYLSLNAEDVCWGQNLIPFWWLRAGVTNLFETESYFLVQIHAKAYQFDTHTSEINICWISKFVLNNVIINEN